MKRYVFILFIFLVYSYTYADFYYYRGQKIPLTKSIEQYIVQYASTQNTSGGNSNGMLKVCRSKNSMITQVYFRCHRYSYKSLLRV